MIPNRRRFAEPDARGHDANAEDTPPELSIIIPTFRRERQVRSAIESALVDDLPRREVLVIDDAPDRSAERTARSIGDPRVRYLAMPEPSGGRPALVRNFGIEEARGEFLYFLDDDDVVVRGSLGRLIAALEGKRAAVAYGTVQCVGPDGEIRASYARWFDWAARVSRRVGWSGWLTAGIILFRGTVIINSACVIRRQAALDLGGYDPILDVYEDVEFFTRGIREYGHVFVDTPVLVYSTGISSIIHDLQGDSSLIHASYVRAHAKFRERHGVIEYRALQIVSRLLPVGSAERKIIDR